MKSRAKAYAVLAMAAATSIAMGGHARRAGSASDGHPSDSGSFSTFGQQGSLVYNLTNAAANWSLPMQIDGSGAKNARVVTTGNSTTGTECWGVAISATGSASVGAAQRGSTDCNTESLVTTPNVTVVTNGSFLVTCTLPAGGTYCKPGITHYSYTQ